MAPLLAQPASFLSAPPQLGHTNCLSFCTCHFPSGPFNINSALLNILTAQAPPVYFSQPYLHSEHESSHLLIAVTCPYLPQPFSAQLFATFCINN